MTFYFSAESSVDVHAKIKFLLNKILYKIESKLGDKEYGEEIVGITAIPIIVSDEFSNIPERKYVSWKNKESDVRLKIDYDSFKDGDFNKCCDLLLENCIQSYFIVCERSAKRKKGDFYIHYEQFIKDFTNTFNDLKNEISQEEIKNFNCL